MGGTWAKEFVASGTMLPRKLFGVDGQEGQLVHGREKGKRREGFRSREKSTDGCAIKLWPTEVDELEGSLANRRTREVSEKEYDLPATSPSPSS